MKPRDALCNKWVSLIAGSTIMLAGGVMYGFSSFSHKMKITLNFTQYEINLVGTMAQVGMALGVLPALFYDKFGPRPTCLLSAVMLFVGYFLTFLTVHKTINSPAWLVAIYFLVNGTASSAGYTASLGTNVKNFGKEQKGKIVGLLTSLYGISGAMFSAFYKQVFNQDIVPYMLFLSIVSGAVPIVGILFLDQQPEKEKKTAPQQEIFTLDTPKTEESQLLRKEPVVVVKIEPQNDQTPIQMLLSLDFWIMALAWFVGSGANLLVTNNLASIVISYGGEDGSQVPMVIVFAFANCTGRLLFGFLSDQFSKYLQRMTWYNIALLIMAGCQFGFAVSPLFLFYPLIIFTGVSYGGMVSTMYSFISDRWGNKYYGLNSAIITVASASSSYLISTLLAASIYQSYIKGSGILCRGRQCYETTFFITTAMCIAAWVSFVDSIALIK
jgi:MFS family permease